MISSKETRGGRDRIELVAESPRVWVADQFLSEAEVDALLQQIPEEGSEAAKDLGGHRNETGFSFEMPVRDNACLMALRDRLTALIGIENDVAGSFRFRRYAAGEGHPEHLDCYNINGASLVYTALLHLEDGGGGGETCFPQAAGGAFGVAPRKGRLVIWANYTPDRQQDPASSHIGATLTGGNKTTLTWFVYGPLAAAAHTPGTGRFEHDPAPGSRMFYINQDVPFETTKCIREACEKRGVDFHEIDADLFDFTMDSPLRPGDMMYRPAVSLSAIKVEQHLYVKGTATLYATPAGVFFDTGASLQLFERAGVPVPRTVYCHTTDRDRLRRYADYVGGFPLLAKFPGSSGGLGVVMIESIKGLFSFIDQSVTSGSRPYLTTYIPDAEHWRIVVVAGKAVAAYQNSIQHDDFRSFDSEDPNLYRFPDDPDMLDSAVRAVETLGVELGGVDILRHPSGRHYVLESNFPCYFATAEEAGGFDISGAIMDRLQEKARAHHAIKT